MQYSFIDKVLAELKQYDRECYMHSVRVWELASRFATFLGWPKDCTERFIAAAPIHDVGKLFIPHEILSKPGKLTDGEWAEIRKHPSHGASYLFRLGVPQKLLDIVAAHHERIDGKGYPNRLEDIPMEARALAICDSVDAMCSTRCYRSKVCPCACIDELQACSGHQFDTTLVDIFTAHWVEIAEDVFKKRALCESVELAIQIE